jgi:hypothetical protein
VNSLKRFGVILLLGLIAGSVRADPYSLSVQRARQANAQNSAPPAAPAAAATAPTDPALTATLQNIAGLQADFAALAPAATNTVTADQKVALLNDLAAAAQQTQLARYVHASFNGAHLTAAQQQLIFDDAKKILAAAAVPDADAARLVDLLKAAAAETK